MKHGEGSTPIRFSREKTLIFMRTQSCRGFLSHDMHNRINTRIEIKKLADRSNISLALNATTEFALVPGDLANFFRPISSDVAGYLIRLSMCRCQKKKCGI